MPEPPPGRDGDGGLCGEDDRGSSGDGRGSGDDHRLVPHPRGPWLLYVRGRCFLVPPALGRSLAPPDGELAPAGSARLLAGIGAAARAAPPHRARGPVRLRWPLLPARAVDVLARRLGGLAGWPVLGVQVVAGAAGYALGSGRALDASLWTGGPGLVAAIAVFLALALWHELGHAAALRREGYPAGAVGLGLLLAVPVLTCDVTPVAALPRAGRLRVDVAGCAFQLGAGGAVFLAGTLLSAPALRWAAIWALMAVVWSLLPFVRTDGYWLLADAVGLPSLDDPVPPPRGRPASRIRLLAAGLAIHRLVHAALLVLVCGVLPWRLAARWHLEVVLARLPETMRPGPPLVRAALVILVLMLVPGMARRVVRLLRSALTDLRLAAGGGQRKEP